MIRRFCAPLWPWAGRPHQTERHLRLLAEALRGKRTPQSVYWTPEWVEREHQADEDLCAGDVYVATDMEDMIAQLHTAARVHEAE